MNSKTKNATRFFVFVVVACITLTSITGVSGAVVSNVWVSIAWADALRFVGKKTAESDLPAPGYPFSLSIELEGTREVAQRVHAVIVRDGRLMTVSLPEGFLNEYDRPQFQASIPSPLYQLTYHFVLERADGSQLISDKFSVNRSCQPDVRRYESNGPAPGDERLRLEDLLWSSRKLEAELVMYDQVEKLVGAIDGMR